MELSDAQELNPLLYENHRLKQVEADLTLDNLILMHLLGEKLRSRLCREGVQRAQAELAVSQRCRVYATPVQRPLDWNMLPASEVARPQVPLTRRGKEPVADGGHAYDVLCGAEVDPVVG